MNAFIEPSDLATVEAGAVIEMTGAVGSGTYTVEAADFSCEGRLELADGLETDALVRIAAGGAGTCEVEMIGTHRPGEDHVFGSR
jgi:hypothetical protein